LSIEDKYDHVMELIALGKEKGYLLYDEVNELLPSDIRNSEGIEDILATFGTAGIEVIEESPKLSPDGKMESKLDDAGEEAELDLSPGSLDITNDPVRVYLREMGTVPLLTRDEEDSKTLRAGTKQCLEGDIPVSHRRPRSTYSGERPSLLGQVDQSISGLQ